VPVNFEILQKQTPPRKKTSTWKKTLKLLGQDQIVLSSHKSPVEEKIKKFKESILKKSKGKRLMWKNCLEKKKQCFK